MRREGGQRRDRGEKGEVEREEGEVKGRGDGREHRGAGERRGRGREERGGGDRGVGVRR